MLFETAELVFGDPNLIMAQDREVEGEERWQTIGMANGVLLLIVAHTVEDEADGDLRIRIISAREVTREERRRYEATH